MSALRDLSTSVVSAARHGAADVRACRHHHRPRRRLPGLGRRGPRVPRLRRRDCRRRSRPLRAGAARGRARAARPPLARVEPLLDGADAAARRRCSAERFDGGRAFFCNSGAEANEAALKIARKATGRTRIVALEGGFHGRTLGALSATGQPSKWEGFGPLVPGVSFARPNDVESLEAALAPAGDTALLLLEPVLGEGGVIPLEPAFAQAAAELALEVGALLCVDEVQAGMGRTGDVLRLRAARDRAPTSSRSPRASRTGCPIGALLAGERAAPGFVPGDHGSTFGGNPVAAAAAVRRRRGDRRRPARATSASAAPSSPPGFEALPAVRVGARARAARRRRARPSRSAPSSMPAASRACSSSRPGPTCCG